MLATHKMNIIINISREFELFHHQGRCKEEGDPTPLSPVPAMHLIDCIFCEKKRRTKNKVGE